MPAVVSLGELREDARRVRLKVSDRVVFLPMGGIWGDLQWMTGVIKKKNKDPIWRYDVEIDLPHLLYPDSHMMRKNDYVTCVGPTAIVDLKKIRKSDLPKLNRGLGPDGILPAMSKLVALRKLWKEILKMDEKNLKSAVEHLKKYPDDPWFRSNAESGPKEIAHAQKMIAEFTTKIDKLKKKGAIEPPERSESSS